METKYIEVNNLTPEARKSALKTLKYAIGSEMSRNLEIGLYSCLYEDDDILLLFDGKEGSGKSKFMRICCAYMHLLKLEWGFHSDWGLDNIHFDLDQYIDAANEGARAGYKGHFNLLDESRKVAGTGPMTKEKKRFLNFLSECRGDNGIHLVALPAFHDMDKNIVLWRSKFVVHTIKRYVMDKNSRVGLKLKRGEYKVYDDSPSRGKYNTVKFNYLRKDEKYAYPRVAAFSGEFKNIEVIDIEGYQEKKRRAKESKYGTTLAEAEEKKFDERVASSREKGFEEGKRYAQSNIEYDDLSRDIRRRVRLAYFSKVLPFYRENVPGPEKIAKDFGVSPATAINMVKEIEDEGVELMDVY